MQTAFYKNPIFWRTLAGEVIGVLVALATFAVSTPGLPKWAQLGAGAVLFVVSQRSYTSHSATVRVAELNVAPPQPPPQPAADHPTTPFHEAIATFPAPAPPPPPGPPA